MDASEARSELVMDIITKRISKSELNRSINELEAKYGKNAFTSYAFNRKPKPWSEADYKKLEQEAMTGAGSKEFLLYLHEMKSSLEDDKIRGIKRIFNVLVSIVKKHSVITAIIVVIAVGAVVYILKMR